MSLTEVTVMTSRKPPSPDKIDVGDVGPVIEVSDLEVRDFVRYAGASGDLNPLHYNHVYARKKGYDTVFSQGMFVGGIASRVVARWFGIAAVTEFGVRFTAQVIPGDSLKAVGTVSEKHTDERKSVVTIDIEVNNQDDEQVATGEATVQLSKRSYKSTE